MHKRFDHQEIEKKWQETWAKNGLYNTAERDLEKEKEYVLVEWPYPSGNLHIGHWYAFAVPDIYVRMRRMQGKQVLFPMGFDAFGLPAENAAIKHNVNPREWTEKNIYYMRAQLASMGNAFSWGHTCNSTDPEYFKWTQWMFTKFFENNLAYRGEAEVNWDPVDNTVIANEQVQADGTSERSGAVVEKRLMPQWMLRITDFADELIDELENVDWPEHTKEAQRNWIGRSAGAEIDFTLSTGNKVTIFTTRPDTLYGATYLVLAPEHSLLEELQPLVSNWNEVVNYLTETKKRSERDRLDATKEKTGVKLEGVTTTNPASGEEVPVYVADYVLGGYGTGAIMAVPAHDSRDREFAEVFDLPVKQVVRKVFGEPLPNPVPRVAAGAIVYCPKRNQYLVQYSHEFKKHSFIFGGLEDGEDFKDAAIRETREETGYKTKFVKYLTQETESHFFHPGKKENRSLVARRVLLELIEDEPVPVPEEELEKQEPRWLTREELGIKLIEPADLLAIANLEAPYLCDDAVGTICNSGRHNGLSSENAKEVITKDVNGRLTDTYRLRDWSIGRQRYWGVPIPIVYDPEGKAHAIPEEHLPWTLPTDVDFKPTGEAPLKQSKELKDRTEKIFGEGWIPEVETMDTFVDSSWYFLRYVDNKNSDSFSSKEAQTDWMQVDTYFGGAEHTTMHLLYSRFWQKALHSLGLVEHNEPYIKRINRGLIIGPDGNKMSKSKGNVIDPDEKVKLVGSDTVKMYLAFMGPYQGTNYPWDNGGMAGVHRFLERVNGLSEHIVEVEPEVTVQLLHKTIKKVTADVAEYKFNTAISAMMVFVNKAEKEGLSDESYRNFLQLLAPFAPHLTEELWSVVGEGSIHEKMYPIHDETVAAEETVTIGVQINGKVRGEITISPNSSEDEAVEAAKVAPELQGRLTDIEISKIIYVPGRILNLIVSEK